MLARLRGQGVRPAPGELEHGRELRLIQVVPDGQLDDLVFLRLELGEDLPEDTTHDRLLSTRLGAGWPGVLPAPSSKPGSAVRSRR